MGIISLFGLCTILAILPLAIYRFVDGDWPTGAGDLVLMTVIGALVAVAWRSGRTALVGTLLALTMTVGYLVLVVMGSISVMWAFPLLAAGFLLADRVFASLSAMGTLLFTTQVPGRFESAVDLWSFVITALLVSLFGLIFATRAEIQRRRLDDLASRDPLTRAGNRRALRGALEAASLRRSRGGEPVSLALIDLDRFKSVNDRFGHEAGDRLLCELVEIANAGLREQDRIFRLGGEEFVVVLPGTPARGGEQVAEKLRSALASGLQGPGGAITASIGVAELGPGEAIPDWLERADKALYEAKRAGRNRVVMAEPVVG